MTEVSLEQLRSRLALFEAKRTHYEWKSDHSPDKLRRHEVWRHSYLSFPYLIGAPDDRIAIRFRDIFINLTELNKNGKIGLLPINSGADFAQKLTHMQEEFEGRGGMPNHVIEEARKPIRRYFENGDPIAVQMFAGYTTPPTPFLVKFGRREFLEPMLCEGHMRICPASFYNNQRLLKAIRDDEIRRYFFLPTFRERLDGKHFIVLQGQRIDFGNDDITLPIVIPDYYLFCLCDHIYYRMPTDFDSDAALVIRDPIRFTQHVISSFIAKWPEWEAMHGPVTYYDPYRDYSKIKNPEMSKHFGYSYQREVRIALRAKRPISTSLQPEFLNIGSMLDYAELVAS